MSDSVQIKSMCPYTHDECRCLYCRTAINLEEIANLRAELDEAKAAVSRLEAGIYSPQNLKLLKRDRVDWKARAEKAEAAIDAVLNLYPNLENYIDSARRDAKGER